MADDVPDRLDLESAIMNAEGAAAVLMLLENELTSSLNEGWERLAITPRENMNVTVLSDIERRAVDYASMSLRQTVAEVSRVFYAMKTP